MMDRMAADSPPCNDPRKCFGKLEYRGQQRCKVLTVTYSRGVKCPFCKPYKDKPLKEKP